VGEQPGYLGGTRSSRAEDSGMVAATQGLAARQALPPWLAHLHPSGRTGRRGEVPTPPHADASGGSVPSPKQGETALAERLQQKVLLDSGASQHMTFDRSLLSDFKPLPSEDGGVTLGDNSCMRAAGTGTLRVRYTGGSSPRLLEFRDVLYVPGLAYTLLSCGAMTAKGAVISISSAGLDAFLNGEKLFTALPK